MEEPVKYGISYVASQPTAENTEKSLSTRFSEICTEMVETFKRKNADYGNSTSKTYQKYGAVSYLTRMDDKFNRIENLSTKGNKAQVDDESLIDSLTDLAVYCLIFRMELENERK